MNRLLQYLRGYCRVRLCSAAPENTLNRLTQRRIGFWGVEQLDPLTIQLCVRRRVLSRLLEAAEQTHADVEVVEELGFHHRFAGLKQRKAFVLSVALILTAAYVLPGFVWYVRVEGNETIPEQRILRELSELGVHCGTWGNSIVPQELKNRMISRIPELEWLTVVRSGGIATAVVREREPPASVVDRRTVNNLVATRDCVITEMEVLSGQAVCEEGDAVLAGQLLVSGYADWEHCIEATRAIGEIYGRTWYHETAVIPTEYTVRGDGGGAHTRCSLLIGQKRINLLGSSRIMDGECDKMISYYPLTLPGGHTFPVTLIVETSTERGGEPVSMTPGEAESLLKEGIAGRLRGGMVAGEIRKEDTAIRKTGGVYRLFGTWECHEMVAKTAPAILMESE